MKHILLFILFMSVVAFWMYGLAYAIVEITHVREEMDTNVGKELIIAGDTLMIYDYSMWSSEYCLSNGSVIDYEQARKFMLKKKQ